MKSKSNEVDGINKFSNPFEEASNMYAKWLENNRWIYEKILHLPYNVAWENKGHVESVKGDITSFLIVNGRVLFLFFLGLLFSSCEQWYFIKDVSKLLYFIAYYLGFVGTFFAAYGFLFYSKGLNQSERIDQVQLVWYQTKIEIRKNISLFIGFFLMSFSFIIQILLQCY